MDEKKAKEKIKEDLEKELQELTTKMGSVEVKKLELDTIKQQIVSRMNEVYKQLGEMNEKAKVSTIQKPR